MKKLWDWFSGKKTGIGMAIMLLAQGVQVFAPGLVPGAQLEYIQLVGGFIGGFGLAHKGVKSFHQKNENLKINK